MGDLANRRRVSITISDDDYKIIADYAAIAQKPPTTIVRDLVVELLPTFKAVVDAVKQVGIDKQSAISSMQLELLSRLNDASSVSYDLQKELTKL